VDNIRKRKKEGEGEREREREREYNKKGREIIEDLKSNRIMRNKNPYEFNFFLSFSSLFLKSVHPS